MSSHIVIQEGDKMTLTDLLNQLALKYDTTRRPSRYFDVPKKGDLSRSEIAYVKKRFKELVMREKCVKEDASNPECYKKTSTDIKPKMRKRTSSYLVDYESIYRKKKLSLDEWLDINYDAVTNVQKDMKRKKIEAPIGLVRIAVESNLPIDILKQVFDIGKGAYASSGSRTGMTAEQWGYGRVYSFIMCYFHNKKNKYSSQRFLKNRTDEWLYDEIVSRLSQKKNPLELRIKDCLVLNFEDL